MSSLFAMLTMFSKDITKTLSTQNDVKGMLQVS
ncbi:hypothetical protein DFP93_104184 [Aneurinibacillus soli]|uniref:Uncharacterized protein n=1 Tax=Aneurinibacillus soli TaxID=1500254 RepID=A0A0U4WEA1_9BACL|nr:hypothetical protein DFP93_104184 [Aneurinibacillus soli]BAU27096.1 hypothetical protein CB4_01265 [Aneurinibacillus soli]